MSSPVLFDKTTTSFSSNGLGTLSDAISCVVTEERNGQYELLMEYYEKGAHAAELDIDMIIYAKPSAFSTKQPFRIYKTTKPLNQKFKVYARHISYDLAYVSVMPFGSQSSAAGALNAMAQNAESMGNFSVGTVSVSTAGTFTADAPASFRNMIGGKSGSILDVFGGELEWNGFTVNLLASRGRDRGLTLRYGKNISDISKTADMGYTVTGITPYMEDANGVVITLPEKTVYKSGASYTTPTRTQVMDMRSYVNESAIRESNPSDTEAQIQPKLVSALRTAAQAYANANLTGVPDVSIELSFVDLGSTEEYKGQQAIFAQAGLCDTVTVEYERLGISVQSKIIKTEYDVLKGRFNKLTIGKSRTNLSAQIYDITKDIDKATADASASSNAVQSEAKIYADKREAEAINKAAQNTATAIATNSDLITGASGGYVLLHRDQNGKPYEILIMDTADIETATKVWRWNQNGLGYSSTGYSGTYNTALSSAGIFNTDFIAADSLSGEKITSGTLDAGKITTGTLDASLIKTGLLQDYAQKNFINMLTGAFSFANGQMTFAAGSSFIELVNNLSIKINGIPLAGEDISDKFSPDIQSSAKMANFTATAFRYPYSCTLAICFDVISDFTSSNSLVVDANGVSPVMIPPGQTSSVLQVMLLTERNTSTGVPTGNIRELFMTTIGSGSYPNMALADMKPSQFRSGYSYGGQITFQTKM